MSTFPGDLSIIDDADRADGAAHDGAGATIWDSHLLGGDVSTLVVSGNRIASSANDGGALTADSVADFIRVFEIAVAGSSFLAYFWRVQDGLTGDWEAYWLTIQGGAWTITKRVAGTSTVIASVDSIESLNNNEMIGIRALGTLFEVYRYAGGVWNQTPVLTATDASIPGAGPGYLNLGNTNWRIDNIASADPALTPPSAGVTIYVDPDHEDASDTHNRAQASDPDTPVKTLQRAGELAQATPEWADEILVKPAVIATSLAAADPRIYDALDHKLLKLSTHPGGLPFGDNTDNEPIVVRGDVPEGTAVTDEDKPIIRGVNARGLKNWIFEDFQQGDDPGSGRDFNNLGALERCEDLTFRRIFYTSGAYQVSQFYGEMAWEDCVVSAPLSPSGNLPLDGRGFGFEATNNDGGSDYHAGHARLSGVSFLGIRGNDAIQAGFVVPTDPVADDARLTVEDCLFVDVTEYGEGGNPNFHTDAIQLLGVPDARIRRNVFIGCSDCLLASDYQNGTIVFENNLCVGGGGLVQVQGALEFIFRHNTLRSFDNLAANVIFFKRVDEPMKLTMVNNIVGGIFWRNLPADILTEDSVIANNIAMAHPGLNTGYGVHLPGLPEFGTSARLSDLPVTSILYPDAPANYELANVPGPSPGIGQGQVTDLATDRLGRAYANPPDVGCHQSSPGTPVTPVARAPYVTARAPEDGAIGVGARDDVTVTLYPKPGEDIDPATVGTATFYITDPGGTHIPATAVALTGPDESGRFTITLDVAGALYPWVTYVVHMLADIADTEGSHVTAETWSFRVHGPSGAVYPNGGPSAGWTVGAI